MTPYYDVGTTEMISSQQMLAYYPNQPMIPLDITVRLGEEVMPYQHIPPTAESVKAIISC